MDEIAVELGTCGQVSDQKPRTQRFQTLNDLESASPALSGQQAAVVA